MPFNKEMDNLKKKFSKGNEKGGPSRPDSEGSDSESEHKNLPGEGEGTGGGKPPKHSALANLLKEQIMTVMDTIKQTNEVYNKQFEELRTELIELKGQVIAKVRSRSGSRSRAETIKAIESLEFRSFLNQIKDKRLARYLDNKSFEDKKILLNDPNVMDTLLDPAGVLIFDDWIKANPNSANTPSTEEIVRTCRDFVGSKQRTYSSHPNAQARMNRRIEETVGIMKEEIKGLEFGRDGEFEVIKSESEELGDITKNMSVLPPTDFSNEENTFSSDTRISTIYKAYSTKQLFSGKPGTRTVKSWLQEMTNKQIALKLTESEFLDMLVQTSIGDPNALLMSFIRHGNSVQEIYKRFLNQYEKSLTPKVSIDKLYTYKATKNNSIYDTMSEVEILSDNASLGFGTNKEFADEYFHVTAIQTLIRALPEYSNRIASEIFADMISKEKQPKYNKFCTNLVKYENPVDKDIAQNGMSPGFNGVISFNNGSDKAKGDLSGRSRQINNVNLDIGNIYYREEEADLTQTHIIREPSPPVVNNLTIPNVMPIEHHINEIKQSSNSVNLPGKKHCGLCLKNNHTAADSCYAIFNDEGNKILQGLTSGPCPNCIEKLQKNIYHPINLCPIRDRAIELYKAKKVIPIGLFRKYFIDNYPEFAKHLKGKYQQGRNLNRSGSQESFQAINEVNYSINMLKQNDLTNEVLEIRPQIMETTPKKLYLSGEITYEKITKTKKIFSCLVDTGSDLNLISRSYLGRMFEMAPDEVEIYLQPSSLKVSTYTHQKVNILGTISLKIFISHSSQGTELEFIVVDDMVCTVCPMIIGIKALGDLNLNIVHIKNHGNNTPMLKHTNNHQVKSSYLSD